MRIHSQRRARLWLFVASTTTLAAPLYAQSAPPPAPAEDAAAAEDAGVEDIVVTARRREESLIDTPISLTAFSAAAIEARNIKGLGDVAAFTPNMSLDNAGVGRSDRATQRIVLRGITPGQSRTTSVLIDGAPVFSGFVGGIDDVERVEVLKGPQSVAFGRSTFAGAVNLVTRSLGDDFGFSVRSTIGTSALFDTRLTVEAPVVPDLLAVRLSARYFTQHGQYKNTAIPGERLGDQSTRSVNAIVGFTPTPELEVKLFGQYWQDKDGPAATGKFIRADYNCNAGAAPAGGLNYLCGTLPRRVREPLAANTDFSPLFLNGVVRNSLGLIRPGPMFAGNLGLEEGGLRRRAWHAHASIDYDIKALSAVLSSLTAANQQKVAVINDVDGIDTRATVNPAFGVQPNRDPTLGWLFSNQYFDKDFSQEFRLASSGTDGLTWLVGANYVYSNSQFYAAGLQPAGISLFNAGNPARSRTYGVFGSLTYEILDALTLSIEGRYQIDKIRTFIRQATGAIVPQARGTFKNFVPRAIAQYHFAPDAQVYVSYAKGVNPGTFNANFGSLTQVQRDFLTSTYGAGATVDPEELKNYELGVKGRFLDGRLQLAVALYRADWTNQIINQSLVAPNPSGVGQTVIGAATNAGKTRLQGVEIEGSLRPFEALSINFSGAIGDSKLKDYTSSCCAALTGQTVFNGNQLPFYSKYNAAIGVDYRTAISTNMEGFGRVDYSYKSGMYDSPANIVKTPSSHVVNIRAGIERGPFVAEAFVENLFQAHYYTSIENNVNLLNFSERVVNVGLPSRRRGGIRLRYDFGS